MTQFLMAVLVLFWSSLLLPDKSQAEDNSVVPERIDPFAFAADISQAWAAGAVSNTPYRFSGKLAPE